MNKHVYVLEIGLLMFRFHTIIYKCRRIIKRNKTIIFNNYAYLFN